MVGGEIDIEEHRRARVLAPDQARGVVVVERVGLEYMASGVDAVDEMLHAGALAERAGGQKAADHRKDREGPVAAAGERARQAARHPPGGDGGDEKLERSIGARGQAGEHVVFGEPARAAGPFHQKFPRLAVEGQEVAAVILGYLDPVDGPDIEARFIVQQDDVREPGRRPAGLLRGELETSGDRGVGFQEPMGHQRGHRVDARAREA